MELNWFRELKASTWSSIPGWTDNILKIYEATWQTRKKNTQVFKCHFTSQWRQRLPRLSWGLSPWCGDSGTCPHHHHLPLPPVGGGPASCGRWAMSQHSLFGFTVEWQLFKIGSGLHTPLGSFSSHVKSFPWDSLNSSVLLMTHYPSMALERKSSSYLATGLFIYSSKFTSSHVDCS